MAALQVETSGGPDDPLNFRLPRKRTDTGMKRFDK
jgi:hypothetical protein